MIKIKTEIGDDANKHMQVLRMLARIKHKPLRDEPTYKEMTIKGYTLVQQEKR